MAYSGIYTSADRTNVKNAIILLATRAAASVQIGGRRVDYSRSDIPFLRTLLSDIELDLAKQSDDGGLALVRPGGRD